jgi:hypothetical protein
VKRICLGCRRDFEGSDIYIQEYCFTCIGMNPFLRHAYPWWMEEERRIAGSARVLPYTPTPPKKKHTRYQEDIAEKKREGKQWRKEWEARQTQSADISDSGTEPMIVGEGEGKKHTTSKEHTVDVIFGIVEQRIYPSRECPECGHPLHILNEPAALESDTRPTIEGIQEWICENCGHQEEA